MFRVATLAFCLVLGACNPAIYTRNGVTDGDTFYLSQQAMQGGDPVLQSWVVYSLARAACQLEVGAETPSRVSTYACESMARRLLAESWAEEQRADPALRDRYLDALVEVHVAGFVPEYVVTYFGRSDWRLPADLDLAGFRAWRGVNLADHRAVTRITGFWGWGSGGPGGGISRRE
jgi:hypothetical protein